MDDKDNTSIHFGKFLLFSNYLRNDFGRRKYEILNEMDSLKMYYYIYNFRVALDGNPKIIFLLLSYSAKLALECPLRN